MDEAGRRIDPPDWSEFRGEMHRLLDACLDRMEAARDLPWQAPPGDIAARVALDGAAAGEAAVFARMADEVMPYATGNTHPRFFGWVHGTGTPAGMAAEIVAATMNSNLGGRHHGAVAVERAVIDWTRRVAGMPAGTSGVLTGGTSQATVLALAAARMRRFGAEVRRRGVAGLPPARVYAAAGAHACIGKALEILGHGSESLRRVAVDDRGALRPDALAEALAEDRAAGRVPLAVVATAGTVDVGGFDPIGPLADLAASEGLWLHADAAFGLWTRLAGPPWAGLADGIGRADSLATDFHKWIGVPYDCGACLIRDAELHRATFAARPDYLQPGAALAGGAPWFCDLGIDLSRGFRALKVWATVAAYGEARLGAVVADNCRQAALMGRLAEASDRLDLAHPVISNVCGMRPRAGDAAEIAAALQTRGAAVVSTTRIGGAACLRAAIVNHRTTERDIRATVAAIEAEIGPVG